MNTPITGLIAIDPGLKPGAVSMRADGSLWRVSHRLEDIQTWEDANPALFGAGGWPLVVTELQWKFKRAGRGKGGAASVQSLLKLAFRAGFTLASVPAQSRVALLPQVWRGALGFGPTLTKEQVQAHIAAKLTPEERKLFAGIPKGRHGDVLDAIGIGRAALALLAAGKIDDHEWMFPG